MQAMSAFWLLLITVVSILAKGNCQCREDDTKNSEISEACNQIYTALESALVSTNNLYVLRIAMHPTSQFAPTLLEVEYNIQLPDNGTFTATLGWTDSGVFASINPRILFTLQLRILYWPLKNLILEPDTITLTLDTRNSEILINAATSDITDVLGILNARLMVYATTQTVLTDWDGTDKGYTWDGRNEKNVLLPFVVAITIPAVVIIFPILNIIFRRELDEVTKLITFLLYLHRELDDTHSLSLHVFLYSLELPAAILTFVECVTSFILFFECHRFSCFVRAFTAIAIFIFALLKPVYTLCHAKGNRWKFISHFIFLKALIAITFISIIPLFLLVVVYPAMMLCAIIIYFSVITMLAVLLSPLGFHLNKLVNQERKRKDKRLQEPNQEEERKDKGLQEPNQKHEQEDNEEQEQDDSGEKQPFFQHKQEDNGLSWKKKKVWKVWKIKEVYKDVKKTVIEKCKDESRILLILVISFITSLTAMLLCLLFMQALLAGATSNVVINFALVIITGFVPGGLIYIMGKAVRNLKFHEGDNVSVNQAKLSETVGPYKLKRKVDDVRCVVEKEEDKKEYVVEMDDLLKNPVPKT